MPIFPAVISSLDLTPKTIPKTFKEIGIEIHIVDIQKSIVTKI